MACDLPRRGFHDLCIACVLGGQARAGEHDMKILISLLIGGPGEFRAVARSVIVAKARAYGR